MRIGLIGSVCTALCWPQWLLGWAWAFSVHLSHVWASWVG